MEIKNNYNECLTNLACSIRKYFELDYKHNTLPYIDEILNEKKPKNVVVMLFDGMGSRILDRTLDKNDFFIKNKYKEITTVFPATTTAATTAIMTGLNPVEHGYLGWNTYISTIDETITLFLGINKDTLKSSDKYLDARKKYLSDKHIPELINEGGKYKALELFPFGDNAYHGLDDALNIIKEECNKDGKKYIYLYDDEPDHSMHDLGPDNEHVKELIKIRNDKVEDLAKEVDDTIFIIVADHGHIVVDNMLLNEHPDLVSLMERTTSIEHRACSFKIKDNHMSEFEKLFNQYYGNYFNLYSKEDIINSKLFGDGDENPLFNDAIGDYIAIAVDSNKTLISDNDEMLYSEHAGYTDDEVYIPLIIVDCTK